MKINPIKIQKMTSHSNSLGYINELGYICDVGGKIILDHKGRKIFVPEEYRKYYDKAICK